MRERDLVAGVSDLAHSGSKRRVFVVGAGVSRSCNIPIARELLGELAGFLRRREKGIYDELQGLLNYLYPGFREKYRNYPNIEDFFGLVDMAQRFNTGQYVNSNLWSDQRLKRFEDDLKLGLSRFLWGLLARFGPSDSVRNFVHDVVSPGDAIITFNWDLTLEQAFVSQSVRYSYIYSRNAESRPCLLKPHGSIDWLDKRDVDGSGELRGGDYFPLSHKRGRRIVVVRYFKRDIKKLVPIAPVLVPPSPFKEFRLQERLPEFKEIWQSVFRAVTDAKELFFLGYSLPAVDQFGRFVFRRALRSNYGRMKKRGKERVVVTVVNPDETAELTFSRLVGREPGIKFIQTSFENWVESVLP